MVLNFIIIFKVPPNVTYELVKRDVASIILIVHGQFKLNKSSESILSEGQVFMVPANIIVKIYVGFETLQLYQTFVNV